MDDIELLQCLIETEINKLKFMQRIAINKKQADETKAIVCKINGLKTSLLFIKEIQNMEE
jgi:hypothetical protein